ncbi:MAG: hypothetical protein V3T15_05985, partial [Pseudomonadales bacterium]
ILQYRFDNAIALSRQCIDEFPQAAICFETLGEARSFAMVREDKLLKVRRSEEDWLHAVELDSDNVRARIQLIRYYRLVPWILGGSKRSWLWRRVHRTRHDDRDEDDLGESLHHPSPDSRLQSCEKWLVSHFSTHIAV